MLFHLVIGLLVQNAPVRRAGHYESETLVIQCRKDIPSITFQHFLSGTVSDLESKALTAEFDPLRAKFDTDALSRVNRRSLQAGRHTAERVQYSLARLGEEENQSCDVREAERRRVLALNLCVGMVFTKPALRPDALRLLNPLSAGQLVELILGVNGRFGSFYGGDESYPALGFVWRQAVGWRM